MNVLEGKQRGRNYIILEGNGHIFLWTNTDILFDLKISGQRNHRGRIQEHLVVSHDNRRGKIVLTTLCVINELGFKS